MRTHWNIANNCRVWKFTDSKKITVATFCQLVSSYDWRDNESVMRNELLQQFEGVVGQYHRDILNYIYRLVGNNYEAEDLAQEAFIKAFQRFESLEDRDKARSWLYSIARNVTIDYFRR